MDEDDPLDELEAADAAYRERLAAVEAVGESALRAVADAHDRLTSLLDSYVGRATGTGDFQAYIQFQEELSTLVSGLSEDLPRRETFEEVESTLDKRRVSEADFERARDLLSPVADLANRLDERDAALERYRRARHAVEAAIAAVRDDRRDLERLRNLGDVDVDAPVERIRDPIETYNDAVQASFTEFKRDRSAREVVGFVAEAATHPLIDYEEPPGHLLTYLRETEAGEESVGTLLEYAEYSRSKLSHYVADVDALKRNVRPHTTYLERLDAGPLTVAWPPTAALDLRWRADELVPVVDGFTPSTVVSRLRAVRDTTYDESTFERLRATARAADELDPEERERLATGAVEAEWERV